MLRWNTCVSEHFNSAHGQTSRLTHMSRHPESFISCRRFGSTHTTDQEQVDLMAALVSETKAAVRAVAALRRTPEVRR